MEQVAGGTVHSHVDHTDLDILRQLFEERASEEVGRTHVGESATERRVGRLPFSEFTVYIVERTHSPISVVHSERVLMGGTSHTNHVRLS